MPLKFFFSRDLWATCSRLLFFRKILCFKFCAACSSGTVKNGDRKNLLSNFIFDVSLGNERHASSENTVTWEGNQPRSRTIKRSSTDLTELIKKLRSVNWINPINYCVTKRRNA